MCEREAKIFSILYSRNNYIAEINIKEIVEKL